MNYKKMEEFILNKLKTELPPYLQYHSIHHITDVFDAAISISKSEDISEQELLLLKTAVLFHDAGYTIQGDQHEAISCKMAKETLGNFDYTKNEIEMICGMIMATQIPQRPKNILEEIICDADLDYLGRDDYWTISRGLYSELNISKPMTERDWLNVQIKFFESHEYCTKTSISLRKKRKDEHLEELKKSLKKLI
jgi:hypothetical protein